MPIDSTFVRCEMNEVENANAEMVLSHFRQWESDFDPVAAFAKNFARDARFRPESGAQSPVQSDFAKWKVGVQEFVGDAQMYIDMGFTARAEIHEIYASGPLVVIDRTDHCSMPGVPDRAVRMMGVFMIVNNKIVEWSDFYRNRTATGEGTD